LLKEKSFDRVRIQMEEEIQMVKAKKIIAITGAAGQIGYALLFRLASGQIFGEDVELELRLIEVEAAIPALKGVVMELEDCGFPLLKKVLWTTDLEQGFADIDWALLIGSAPRKAGMERADLLQINGTIFKTQGKALNKVAGSKAKIFVVGNPCNTNAMIAMHYAPNIPKEQFFAMTMLDQHRAAAQLAMKAGVTLREVQDVVIWGNHSASQFPDFAHARIAGQAASSKIDEQWLRTSFVETVQQRGAAVIAARGMSSAASAANAALDTVAALEGLKFQDSIFSVGSYSNGEYGAAPGLIVSYPSQIKDGRLQIVDGWEHDAFARQKIQHSFAELQSERDEVSKLGLMGG
jgi:malate dehydrogenase